MAWSSTSVVTACFQSGTAATPSLVKSRKSNSYRQMVATLKIIEKLKQKIIRAMCFYNFQNNFLIILSESDPSMLGFQESAMKLEDSISDFRKILSLATNTTSDFRNPGRKRERRGRIAGICTFTAPVAARFSGIRCLSCRII